MPQLDLSDALSVRVANQDVLEVKIAGETVWPIMPVPIAAYNFDLLDENSNIPDLSGNGHTLFTTVNSFYVAGKEGQAISSLADGSVVAATSNFGGGRTALTIMGWFYVRTGNGNNGETPLFGFFSNVDGDTMFAVWQSRDAFGPSSVLQGDVRTTGLQPVSDGVYVLPVHEWTHVALTFDGVSLAARLYVNGAQIAEGTMSDGVLAHNNFLFFVGGYGYGGHDADSDDVRVYDATLTDFQIQLAMNTPVE